MYQASEHALGVQRGLELGGGETQVLVSLEALGNASPEQSRWKGSKLVG